MNWSQAAQSTGFRATGGRRAHNARRQRVAAERRNRVARLLAKDATLKQAELARRLGVDRATICRDVATLRGMLTRLGGIESLGFLWTLYVEGRAVGNTFHNVFGCGNRFRLVAAKDLSISKAANSGK